LTIRPWWTPEARRFLEPCRPNRQTLLQQVRANAADVQENLPPRPSRGVPLPRRSFLMGNVFCGIACLASQKKHQVFSNVKISILRPPTTSTRQSGERTVWPSHLLHHHHHHDIETDFLLSRQLHQLRDVISHTRHGKVGSLFQRLPTLQYSRRQTCFGHLGIHQGDEHAANHGLHKPGDGKQNGLVQQFWIVGFHDGVQMCQKRQWR